ncbi:MAG: hypothetical protein ACKV2U_24645 [Bryobacteraceae bacterium]
MSGVPTMPVGAPTGREYGTGVAALLEPAAARGLVPVPEAPVGAQAGRAGAAALLEPRAA